MTIHKPNRTSSDVFREIRRIKRHDLFTTGELLIEAKQKVERERGYGHWGHALRDELDINDSTADRYMAAASLVATFPNLRNLNVLKGTVDALSRLLPSDEIRAKAIEALKAELANRGGKHLTNDEAEDLILLERARHDHGADLPDATLREIIHQEHVIDIGNTRPWDQDWIACLKKNRPVSEDEVEQARQEFEQQHYSAPRAPSTRVTVDEVPDLGARSEPSVGVEIKEADARSPDRATAAPTRAALPPAVRVEHVADRVRARQSKARELTAQEREQNIRQELSAKIKYRMMGLSSAQLASVLQHINEIAPDDFEPEKTDEQVAEGSVH